MTDRPDNPPTRTAEAVMVPQDDKDKIIEFLSSEIARLKEAMTAVYEMKSRWQKNRDAYGKRYTILHNDYVRLINLLQKHGIPLPDVTTPAKLREEAPVLKVNNGRKRWKP